MRSLPMLPTSVCVVLSTSRLFALWEFWQRSHAIHGFIICTGIVVTSYCTMRTWNIHRKHGGHKPSSSCSQPKKAKLLGGSGKKHARPLVVTTAPDAIALDRNEKKLREALLKVY